MLFLPKLCYSLRSSTSKSTKINDSIFIFQIMRPFRPENFSSLLVSNEKMVLGLDPYLAEIANNNIECTFGVMQELAKTIRLPVDPIRKINALLAMLRCMEGGNYSALLFAEVYVVPSLTKVVEFLLENRDFQSIATYFEKNGYSSSLSYIQNLSYNYVALVCKVLQTGTIIKPFRAYEGQDYEEPSLFSRWFNKLVKQKASIALNSNENRGQIERSRYLYTVSLGKWVDYADSVIYFFMEILDGYLANDSFQKSASLFDILQYGQSIITEETIARLIDIIAYHLNFDVRIKALKLLDRLILWGDVEALLVVNFTENIETIIKSCWQVKGERSLQEGRHIYPEITGQQAKKQQFYRSFLMSFQCWAITYPNHQFIAIASNNINDPSPIYQLYKLLREKKKIIFPNNPTLTRFQSQSRMAMLQKTYRNRLILREINNQSQLNSVSIVLEHKLKDVQEYYDVHKEILVNLISKKTNPFDSMQKLTEFQLHFEQMVELLSLQDDPGVSLDKLIESGLELIEIITLIHSPFLQLLHGDLTEKEFFDKIMKQCVNYYSPGDASQLTAFYSEKVAHKKQSLVEMLRIQKSDPLEKDLKYITNSIMVKQFRHKYRQKLEKLSSSKNSQQSELNLEIFTKTKFTRESRQEMEMCFKFDKKESSKEISTSNKELKVKNSQISYGNSSLKGSREKKKLSLATKQLQNKRKEQAQGQNQNRMVQAKPLMKIHKIEVTSDTRSSRGKQSQKSQKILEHLVSYHENSQYFSFIPNENYKFSYICHQLLIFKSPFLTIERTISQDEDHPCKVKIEMHLTTHKYIPEFQFSIEDQQCIKMEVQPQTLPINLENNCRFKIQILGQMRKIPLRLPTIALFIRKRMFFQYILPFTFNFFLRASPPNFAIEAYNSLKLQAKHRYATSNLIISKIVLPQQDLLYLPYIFQGSFMLEEASRQSQRYLWHASFGKLAFIFLFQLNISNRTLVIRGFDAKRSDDYNESILKYTVNLLAHILSERQA